MTTWPPVNVESTHFPYGFGNRTLPRLKPERWLILGLCWLPASPFCLHADEIDDSLQAIATVGPLGMGSQTARQARDRLARRGTEILPRLLAAMDRGNVVANNWYRTIFEDITRRELKKTQPRLRVSVLQEYVSDPAKPGRARRLVLSLLDRIEPDFRIRLIPTLLDDPEFRNDAIATFLTFGDKAHQQGRTEMAKQAYHTAFKHARDAGQLSTAARELRRLGEQVSIADQMGFVTEWYLLGPFAASGISGFDRTFPPEQQVELDTAYPGKNGGTIRWKPYRTTNELGQLDLIEAIAPVKEAVGYAYTQLDSPRDQLVQLRCGADDNLTIWLNGQKILNHRQWLNGTRLDRFTTSATLRKGTNRLLVKICQGPQHKNPNVPNNWSLQLRFCDDQGTGIPLQSVLSGWPDHTKQDGL